VDEDWARVQKVASGSDISLTLRGLPVADRYFVSADASSVTVMNLTDLALPAAATRRLRQIALENPDYFSRAANGATFVLSDVRLERAGVFLNDEKVVELPRIIGTVARPEVEEITIRQKGRGIWGHLGPLGGYFVGAMAGGLIAGAICQAAAGRDRCDTGAFLGGTLVGGVAGGLYGLSAARRETELVVYRAP
jgi:hypothetical protein